VYIVGYLDERCRGKVLPFLETAGGPANNKNMMLTFGVGTSNSTPAGTYSTNLNLIAVGTF
jgi:hypothetical protein